MHRRAEEGWLEVIAGPMFSGKSEELIRRVTRYELARVPVQTFKPAIDNRYADTEVVSHSHLRTAAIPVADSDELLRTVEDRTVVVGIDEGQFFDDGLVEVATTLAGAGKQLIIAGLDTDYLGRPFEPIPSLMLVAEYVTKTLAVCHRWSRQCSARIPRTTTWFSGSKSSRRALSSSSLPSAQRLRSPRLDHGVGSVGRFSSSQVRQTAPSTFGM